MNYPVTAIRTHHLSDAALNRYQVLILPEGNYTSTLGEAGAARLAACVRQGGVLLTLGSATAYAASNEAGLLDIKREDAYQTLTKEPAESSTSTLGSLLDSDSAFRSAIVSS